MSKGLKIGLGIGAIVIIALVLYFLLRTPAAGFRAIKGGDISGTQYDLSIDDSGLSLDAAKNKAVELGAKAFLVNGTRTIFKNASGPVTTDPAGTYTLYVKE